MGTVMRQPVVAEIKPPLVTASKRLRTFLDMFFCPMLASLHGYIGR